MSIKLNANEIRYIALFENMTGATVKDCIIDDENGKIIFVVKEGDMGLAIGKKGATVSKVQNAVDKGVEIVEFSEDVTKFVTNLIAPAQIQGVKISQKANGETIAIITADNQNKRIAIGKNGQNIEKAKLIAKRQHNISDIILK
ncbi:MAG: NusA-like transcription termination signal-binding factor [Methanobrevibacter sp.]|jgi:N utilization substance protein A|nr:NusA-like transcription termination signal-binding factor [Candidatus Methanoflexus mossambicus]